MAATDFNVAVKELFHTLYGTEPTNFSARLYQLIMKADRENLWRLRQAFPFEVEAWDAWQRAPDEKEFFKQHGLLRR